MRILIMTFGTENHGEVIVKVRHPAIPMTKKAVKALARSLIPTYLTKKKGIPLKEFRRAKYVDIEKTEMR